MTTVEGGALDDVDAAREHLLRTGTEWPGAALTLAEVLLDGVVAEDEAESVAASDTDGLGPEQAARILEAWDLLDRVRAESGRLDAETLHWSSLLMGRAAVIGQLAGLDLTALIGAADALRASVGAVAESPELYGELNGLCLEVLAAVLLELVDRAEPPDDVGAVDPRDELLEEVLVRLSAARDVADDAESYFQLTAELGRQAYRLHTVRGGEDGRVLDTAIAELDWLATSGHATPDHLLFLANAYEDRFLGTHAEADRSLAVRTVSALLAEPDVPVDDAAAARSLRGRVQLVEPIDPAAEAAALADLTVAVDVLGADDFDGWAAALDLSLALLRRGLHDDREAGLAARCLELLVDSPGTDPDEHAELVTQLALVVLQRAYVSQRWDEVYLPALERVTEDADQDDADVAIVATTAISHALRAATLFMTTPRERVAPLLTEAIRRLEHALTRPGTEELAAGLHGMAGMALWLLLTPDDWSPTISFHQRLDAPDDYLLGLGGTRDLARRALDHFDRLREESGPDTGLPPVLLVVLRMIADGGEALSDDEIQLLRAAPASESDLIILLGTDFLRGALLAEEAWRRGDIALLQDAIGFLRHGIRDASADHPARPFARVVLARALSRLGQLTCDDGLLVTAHEELRAARREGSGQKFVTLADEVTRDLLAAGRHPVPAIEETTAVSAVPDPSVAAALQAEALALRQAGDSAARGRARAALREYSRCVLIEPDAASALAVAELANDWAAVAASWALDDGHPDLVVELLEHGRAMTLHAVTATADGAAILRATGHEALASDWVAGRVDGTRRTDVLATLGDTPAGQMLHAVPQQVDIGAALWDLSADALVYLVRLPRPDGAPRFATALLVRPGKDVEVLELPPCTDDTLIEGYLRAYRRAFDGSGQDASADDVAQAAWRDALADLANWAEEAVAAPLREYVGGWKLPHHPRLVLVPLGELATVPWAAARRRTPDGWRYLIEDARISSAASARQVVEVSRRDRLDPATVVIVANPGGDLPYAARGAAAMRDQFYPEAYCSGRPAARFGARRGSPQDVLDAMPSGVSAGAGVLHLSAHAVLDPAPERSRVVLADGESLTVGNLLSHARLRDPASPGGLVVLDCCATDRTGRAPDEALTLSTAFLAAGAASAIGTRWPIADGVAAVASFVLHRFLCTGGLPPADALRRTQLWLLDPDREMPAEMPRALVEVAIRTPLTDPSVWAAFTHHGR